MDPENSFYKEEWATRYAEYDPDTANRLLDEMCTGNSSHD